MVPTSPSACVSACISAAAALSSEDVKGPACISRSSECVKLPLERSLERRAWAPVDEGIAVLGHDLRDSQAIRRERCCSGTRRAAPVFLSLMLTLPQGCFCLTFVTTRVVGRTRIRR